MDVYHIIEYTIEYLNLQVFPSAFPFFIQAAAGAQRAQRNAHRRPKPSQYLHIRNNAQAMRMLPAASQAILKMDLNTKKNVY